MPLYAVRLFIHLLRLERDHAIDEYDGQHRRSLTKFLLVCLLPLKFPFKFACFSNSITLIFLLLLLLLLHFLFVSPCVCIHLLVIVAFFFLFFLNKYKLIAQINGHNFIKSLKHTYIS